MNPKGFEYSVNQNGQVILLELIDMGIPPGGGLGGQVLTALGNGSAAYQYNVFASAADFSGVDPTGATDSAAGIQAALAALAPLGVGLLLDGHFKVGSPINVPSGAQIRGTPRTVVEATMTVIHANDQAV